ncbi:hypothetical protein QR680_001530 [Steinernema hermaphroditum]|uniref:Neurotransmitter-gated ion-channel ligand-binding domain-containing protein n=1 Tax=Steinernema hermaphroditum TaxID=289476 RepID=A0AA39LG46_9BILA|nr:hypothetical protein QR680_001530 [Steinernema hermaphroditum]
MGHDDESLKPTYKTQRPIWVGLWSGREYKGRKEFWTEPGMKDELVQDSKLRLLRSRFREEDPDWIDPKVPDGTSLAGPLGLDSKKYKNITIKGDQAGSLEEFQDNVYRNSHHYKDIISKFNISKEHPGLRVSPVLNDLMQTPKDMIGRTFGFTSWYHLGPRFFDKPLNEGTFEKGLACAKYAGLLMIPYTAFEIRAYNTVSVDDFRPRTFFKRYLQVARIPVTVAFAWGSTLSFAANLRHKDDFYNHYFASAAVGTVVATMKDNIALGVTTAFVSTILGLVWQYSRISDTGLQNMLWPQGGTAISLATEDIRFGFVVRSLWLVRSECAMRGSGTSLLFLFFFFSQQYDGTRSGYMPNCIYRTNHTDLGRMLGGKQYTMEHCVYYYLVDKEQRKSGDGARLFLQPPPSEDVLNISVDDVAINQVELLPGTSAHFNVYGDIFITWHDERLSWEDSAQFDKDLELHEPQHIWTPKFTDNGLCTVGCMSSITRVKITSDGVVTAQVTFKFAPLCTIDYYRYPEETNDCCIYIFPAENDEPVQYIIRAPQKQSVDKVAMKKVETDHMILITRDSSAWNVEDRTIKVIDVKRFEVLQLCVHAVKKMSTLRMALRVPVTIATMLMLVSPLFGDLKIQSYVKLVTLCLQTMCFLFLCSIAPENGFGGIKPKIYTFYEFLFVLSLVSVFITVLALALSRVRRTVPPMHGLYLTAKMVNRFVCCIEPEDSNSYERQFDELPDSVGRPPVPPPERDYTTEWRHIFIAGNNLFSGLSFTIFVLVTIFDIL